jgi:hypothetical protein
MKLLQRTIFSLLFFIASYFSSAQEITEFGQFSFNEIDMKECSFDKGAEAVILFDKATSNYNDQYNLITERRIRFKILKEKAISRGNISIYFTSKNDFETIARIRGIVGSYDENGNFISTKLEQKSIFKRKINENYSEVTFAMPNVKVGSIVEYEYESRMDHYGGLEDWYFQSDIPTIVSSYNLFIVPTAEFTYSVRKSDFMQATVKPDPKEGSVYFEMKNIPGLRDESYSTSYRDFLQKVDFQLSAVASRGSIKRYTTTWKLLTKELLEDKDFGSQLDKNFSISNEVKPLLSSAGNNFEKMKLIHSFVKNNIAWNNIDSKYAIDGLKRVVEKKQGTSGELNLLMINLLRLADLDADPMLVSERSHGRVDTSYPFKDQFNKVVAYVNLDGKKYILDASDAYTPSGMTPIELLNTIGFVVDKKEPVFVRIGDEGRKKAYLINVVSKIDPSAQIVGEASVSMFDYARVSKAHKYISDKDGYIADFLKSDPELKIDSFSVTNLETDSLPLVHQLLLKHPLNKSGNYFLMNSNLFTGFEKNPFVADYRFTNIDFGSRYICVVNNNFTIPDNMVVDSYPKNARISLPGNTMTATRQISQKDNAIVVSMRIEFNTAQFEPENYDSVKEFFKKMTEMLNEPLVLKSK